jgi:hypothetical protein
MNQVLKYRESRSVNRLRYVMKSLGYPNPNADGNSTV